MVLLSARGRSLAGNTTVLFSCHELLSVSSCYAEPVCPARFVASVNIFADGSDDASGKHRLHPAPAEHPKTKEQTAVGGETSGRHAGGGPNKQTTARVERHGLAGGVCRSAQRRFRRKMLLLLLTSYGSKLDRLN